MLLRQVKSSPGRASVFLRRLVAVVSLAYELQLAGPPAEEKLRLRLLGVGRGGGREVTLEFGINKQ